MAKTRRKKLGRRGQPVLTGSGGVAVQHVTDETGLQDEGEDSSRSWWASITNLPAAASALATSLWDTHQREVIATGGVVVVVVALACLAVVNERRENSLAWARLREIRTNYEGQVGKEDTEVAARASALKDLDEMLDKYGGADATPFALLKKAELLRTNQDFGGAIDAGKRLRKECPDTFASTVATILLAQAHEQRGQKLGKREEVEAAANYYREALAKGPQFMKSEAGCRLGLCLESLGEYKGAMRVYQEVRTGEPQKYWDELAAFRMEALRRDLGRPKPKPSQPSASSDQTPPGGAASNDSQN